MCGIIYVEGRNNANTRQELLNRFVEQKHRGTEGFGFVAIKDGVISAFHRAEEEDEIRTQLLVAGDFDAILFHHRIPTSTPNYAGTAHPFKISHESFAYDYYVVHNGVITNTNVMQKEHEDMGIKYKSRYMTVSGVHFPDQNQHDKHEFTQGKHNDSESIAVELALFLEGKKQTIDTIGGAAIIGLQVIKDTNEIESVFYGHNEGRPLVWEQPSGKKMKRKKPTVFALKSEGKGNLLPSETLYVRDYKTKTEICYKIEIGSFIVASKPYMGYGANYELPEPAKHSKERELYSMAQHEVEAEIQNIEIEIETLHLDKAEFSADLALETDLGSRSQIRRKIIETDQRIKLLTNRLDEAYFYGADRMFTD
jgi:hypothetical protein